MGNTSGKGTLKYRKVQRTVQTGENAGKAMWYATAVQDRTMSFDDFVSHIAAHKLPLLARHRAGRTQRHPRLPEGADPRRQERQLNRLRQV